MTRPRFRLPDGLDPDEERLILASLARYFRQETSRPDPWSLAGRMDAAGQGALQARRLLNAPWGAIARSPFARRGAPPYHGRADAS
jgi:hypothetical protein